MGFGANEMKLYCLNKHLGDSWFNVWCGTKDEAISMAKAGDTVVVLYTAGDKESGIELLNNSTMHHSNFHELEGVGVVEQVWPTTLRR